MASFACRAKGQERSVEEVAELRGHLKPVLDVGSAPRVIEYLVSEDGSAPWGRGPLRSGVRNGSS
jgi:hypothetical protein